MTLARTATLLALSPLLAAQALSVVRRTPRLPEAAGQRSGTTGPSDAPPLRLLILGDSSAAGVGAATQSEALAGQLAQRLAPHTRLTWQVIARSGATTADALGWLDSNPPAGFDVVVTALGVNDVLRGVSRRRWMTRQKALHASLHACFAPRHIFASGLPPMHAFPVFPQPLRALLGAGAASLDAALAAHARATPALTHIPAPRLAGTHLLARDGMHPGPAGYAAWAELLAPQIACMIASPSA